MKLEAYCEECGVRHGGHKSWCSQATEEEKLDRSGASATGGEPTTCACGPYAPCSIHDEARSSAAEASGAPTACLSCGNGPHRHCPECRACPTGPSTFDCSHGSSAAEASAGAGPEPDALTEAIASALFDTPHWRLSNPPYDPNDAYENRHRFAAIIASKVAPLLASGAGRASEEPQEERT